jgi:endoglucanase
MSNITFTASSTLAQNVGAHVNVIVDGVKIGSTYVGSTTKTYSFTAPNLASNTAHDVQIVYDNDAVISGVDRNLLLNSISVDGKTFAATSAYEVYHATGGPGNIASSGNMNWAGTAEFSLPASLFPSSTTTAPPPPPPPPPPPTTGTGPDTITFTASATLAQNVGAHVNVIVDGQNIGSTYVGATTATYSFNTTLAPNSAHDVKLVYDNDAVVSGVDRNLQLNSIGINGKTYAATSAYEVYHRSFHRRLLLLRRRPRLRPQLHPLPQPPASMSPPQAVRVAMAPPQARSGLCSRRSMLRRAAPPRRSISREGRIISARP